MSQQATAVLGGIFAISVGVAAIVFRGWIFRLNNTLYSALRVHKLVLTNEHRAAVASTIYAIVFVLVGLGITAYELAAG